MPAFGEHLKRYYPGITPKEERVWRHWLKEHEDEFDAFEYNVHVGEGVRVTPAEMLQPDPVAMAIAESYRKATQLKIDALGFRSGEVWIFEVEDRATSATLGQLQTYGTLLPRARSVLGPVELAVVCRFVGADMLDVFDEAGIIVFQQAIPVTPP